MTAVAAPTPTFPSARFHLSFGRMVRSELIKLVTVRSTWWSLAIMTAMSLALTAGISWATQGGDVPMNPVSAAVGPMQLTMLVAGVLGSIIITGEYATGMIRSTLTAEPRRGVVLTAKALAAAIVMIVTTVVTYAIAVPLSAAITGASVPWSEPTESIQPLALGVLAMVTFVLLGLGCGFLIRNGGGAIATTVGILFVLPIVLSMFSIGGESWMWLVELSRFAPMSAAGAVTAPGATDLAEPLLALLAWPAVALVGGWLTLRSRDA